MLQAIVAEFASRVAIAANEGPESTSSLQTSRTQESHQQTPSTRPCTNDSTITNMIIQSDSSKDSVNSQCNNSSTVPTQTAINPVQSSVSDALSTVAPIAVVSCPVKVETNQPITPTTVWPQNDTKQQQQQPIIVDEIAPTATVLSCINRDNITVQTSPVTITPSVVATADVTLSESQTKQPTTVLPVAAVSEVLPTETTPSYASAALLSGREPFPVGKSTFNSPPRRKSHNQHYNQPQTTTPTVAAPSAAENVTVKETRERKISDKTVVPKCATPTPGQTDHYQKANGEAPSEKLESDGGTKVDSQLKSADGKLIIVYYFNLIIKCRVNLINWLANSSVYFVSVSKSFAFKNICKSFAMEMSFFQVSQCGWFTYFFFFFYLKNLSKSHVKDRLLQQ